MSTINKVWTGTSPTHTFKDDVSGFGIFSAAQGLTPTGHTKVASLAYQTFNTTTAAFGATTNVDFYSNSGSSSGNDWVASVEGTNLLLNSNGSGGESTLLGQMPDISNYTNVTDVVEALVSAGLVQKTSMSKTTYSYSSLGPTVNLRRYSRIDQLTIQSEWAADDIIIDSNNYITTADLAEASNRIYAVTNFTQSPGAGAKVFTNSVITAYQINPGGDSGDQNA